MVVPAAAVAGGGARVPALHVARQPGRAPLVGVHELPERPAGQARAGGQGARPALACAVFAGTCHCVCMVALCKNYICIL